MNSDAITLSDWYESRQVARATAFRLVKVAGITPRKVRRSGSRALVSALDQAMVASLDRLADRLKQGESMAQLEAAATTALVSVSPSEPISDDPSPTASPLDPGPFLARLEAAERAIRSGLGLTTAEVSWILGVRPGSSPITRGGITATRTGWNCWRLQSADSAD